MEKEADMSPVTAQEFKAWLEAEYAEAQGPFTAEKIGAPEFVIMRTSDLERFGFCLVDGKIRILDKECA